MSDEVQRLVVEQVWDTTSVEEGSQVVDKALTRQQQALDSTAKAVERYNRAVGDMADAKRKAAKEGGGHGGHGGGGFGENLKWGLHDLAEGRGQQGLFRLASAFGVVGTGAIAATQALKLFNAAREADNKAIAAIESGQVARGEGRESIERRNQLYRPLMRLLPATLFDQGEAGTGVRQSEGGIAEQRAEIEANVKQSQDARTYLGTLWSYYTWPITGHDHEQELIDNEDGDYKKLAVLDQRTSGIVRERTAAERLRAFGSDRAGELALSKTKADEEAAVLGDQNQTGKMGVGEYSARLRASQTAQEIREREINLRFNEGERARQLLGSDIGVRERGTHVAEYLAQNHMQAARQEEKEAPTDEAKSAAHSKYVAAWDQEREANKSWRERDTRLDAEKEIANYRGSAEDRALFGAERELQLQKDLLSIAKERGADAEKAAQVAVDAAQKTLDLLKQQQAVARIGYQTADATGKRDVWAAGARLRGASPEEATRIGLDAHVQNADDEYHAAKRKAHETHWDAASRATVHATHRSWRQAQAALGIYDKDFARDRSRELTGAQGETAAERWNLYGRADLASLTSERTQSRLAIEDAEFHHNQPLADERRAQQGYRERSALVAKYLNPDGTRRNPADVQAEEIENRRRQTRIDQFFGGTPDTDPGGGLHAYDDGHGPAQSTAAKRLAAIASPFAGTSLSRGAERVGSLGLGLVGVEHGLDGSVLGAKDALTGEHLNAQQVAEHIHTLKATAAKHVENAKDDRSDREIQQGIYEVLNTRLPKDPQS